MNFPIMNGEYAKSAEDELLDPIARSILRDIQAEADRATTRQVQAAPSLTNGQSRARPRARRAQMAHVSQGHSPPFTLALDDGRVVDCKGTHLTWNELVACNTARQEGQDYASTVAAKMVDTPLTIVRDPDKGTVTVILLDSGEVIKCDEEELTENEIIHCNMALEQDGNDADGEQGGQAWEAGDPTASPSWPTGSRTWGPTAPRTLRPTVLRGDPTGAPASTSRPTRRQQGPPSHANPRTSWAPTPFPTTSVPPSDYPPTPPPTSLPPTTVPTSNAPTFYGETAAPSFHPTPHGDPFVLRGTVYYDHNANGRRDSNVDTTDFGDDAEYSVGLGGVTIQLVECDPNTGAGMPGAELRGGKKGDNSYASTVTRGYDVLFHPRLAGREEDGGSFDLINIKINRAYYIYVTAPEGYIFTDGVCNDDINGWGCRYGDPKAAAVQNNVNQALQNAKVVPTAKVVAAPEEEQENVFDDQVTPQGNETKQAKRAGGRRRLSVANAAHNAAHRSSPEYSPPTPEELALGIRSGRSSGCVNVDRTGLPDSRLDVGVMRIGDIEFSNTEVELNMELADAPELETRSLQFMAEQNNHRPNDLPSVTQQSDLSPVKEKVEDALRGNGDGSSVGFVLLQKDKDAIGVVTAEVLASNLDKTLSKKGAVLDSVAPVDVLYIAPSKPVAANITDAVAAANTIAAAPTGEEAPASKNRPPPPVRNNGPQGRGGKLSVSVLVRGHYNKNSKDGKNFDDIVQDSINRDTGAIRRQLTTYNENCKDQTTKVVDLGFTTNDFSEIHSERGADPTKSRAKRRQQQGQDEAEEERAFSSACDRKKVLPDYFEASLGALEVKAKVTKPRTYVVEEESAGPWAIMGTMIAVVLVALCFIYYLLRLGLKRKRLMNQDDSYVTETNSLGWDSEARSHDSRADKIEEYEREMALAKVKSKRALLVDETFPSITKPKKRGYLARMVRREIGNMTAALTNDRWRFYDDDDDGDDDGLKKSTGGLPHDAGLGGAGLGGLEAKVESSGGSPSDPNASSLEPSDFENLSGSAKLSDLELQDSKEKMRASMRRSSTGTLSRSFSGGDGGWGSLRSGGMSYESGYKLDGSKRSLMSRESGYNLDGSKRSLPSRRLSIDGSNRSLPGVTQVSYDSGLVSPSSRASGRRPSGRSSTRRHSRNAVPLITGMDLEDGTIVEEESGEGESSSSSSGSSSDDDSSDSSSDSSSSSSDDDNGEARKQPRKRGPSNKKKKTKSGKKKRKRREVGARRPSSAASKGSQEERRFGRSLMSAEEMETSFVGPHVQWDIPSGSTSSRTSSSRSSRRATLS